MIITSSAEKIAIKHPITGVIFQFIKKNKPAQSINTALKGFGILSLPKGENKNSSERCSR